MCFRSNLVQLWSGEEFCFKICNLSPVPSWWDRHFLMFLFYLEKVHRMMQAAISIYESTHFHIEKNLGNWDSRRQVVETTPTKGTRDFKRNVSSLYNSLFLAREVKVRFNSSSLLSLFWNFDWSMQVYVIILRFWDGWWCFTLRIPWKLLVIYLST